MPQAGPPAWRATGRERRVRPDTAWTTGAQAASLARAALERVVQRAEADGALALSDEMAGVLRIMAQHPQSVLFWGLGSYADRLTAGWLAAIHDAQSGHTISDVPRREQPQPKHRTTVPLEASAGAIGGPQR